jgi:oxygen-independent coproporphyrinogen-3 oxidase
MIKKRMISMKEVGLYIHIPFCRSKCLYCDFNSYERREADAEAYVHMLLKEHELYREKHNFTYKTVFIGGGTPTVINYRLMGELMETLAPYIIDGAEISMEANPGTVTPESLKYYRSIGINRLSIGLQACQDELLRGIGRIHSWREFVEAYEAARNAGFHNINVDLMFALPGQTMAMWEETLERICSLRVEHISCYSLKLEEGTRLYSMKEEGRLLLPDEDMDRDMYERAVKRLMLGGYDQYEISNFAKKGMECKHNLIYWRNEEYLGLGAGSHSKLEGSRFWNLRNIDQYIDLLRHGMLPIEDREVISEGEDAWETIILALRLNEGLDIRAFEAKYRYSFRERYGTVLERLTAQGLIILEDERLKLTDKGRDLSNSVFIEFL